MITILTNYRTGSTFYCDFMAEKNNYKSFQCPFDVSTLGMEQSLMNLQLLGKDQKNVIKMMPDLFDKLPNTNLFDLIIENTNTLIYLIRKDYNAQLQSYVASHQASWWKPKDDEKMILNPTYNKEEYNNYDTYLRQNYKKLARYYAQYPGTLVVLEDDLPYKPYSKEVVWDKTPPTINFEPLLLFPKR